MQQKHKLLKMRENSKMEDVSNVSLCVPLSGDSDGKMEGELQTIQSIARKNIKELNELKEKVKTSPLFKIISPIPKTYFKDIKRTYVEHKDDYLQTIEKYNSEYNSLLKKENQLLCQIGEEEKNFKRLKLEVSETTEKFNTLKKMYQDEKNALHAAKKIYENSFGMEVNVNNIGDDFTVSVAYGKKVPPVILKINRATKTIKDFEVSHLSLKESEELKLKFKQSSNAIALNCALNEYTHNIN